MASAPAGTVVLRDAIELGGASFGIPLPVDPGDHVVVVRWPGRAERRYELKLMVGQTREVTLEPGPAVALDRPLAPDSASKSEVASEDQGGPRRTLGIVTMSVGGAGILTSLVFGAVALSAKQTVDAECEAKRCSQAGLDAADRGSMAAKVSTVSFGVGVAAAALGIVLLLGAGEAHPVAARLPLSFGIAPLKNGGFLSAVGRLP
jgi:hypothetical protein